MTTLIAAATCACTRDSPSHHDEEIPIACVLGALDATQRDREAVLLDEHLTSIREVKELDDGYAFRYAADVALFGRMAELVALEHRCCPFLDFELQWSRAADPWLQVRGGSRVKSFVLDTFAPKSGGAKPAG